MSSKKIYKYIFIGLGWFFVGLGIVGIVTPLLPTTVFFLIAAWFFAKSSDHFYLWLINHPRFGKFIKDYREKRGMPLKSKIVAVIMLNITILSSIMFFTQNIYVRILLVIIAVSVSAYIISLNTIKNEPSD
ncbi:MAG: YbaN family protein [Melioribacteraceae bacterium]|nr:YbaN family protein [Melioribacteraceae bacterium]